jgi:hypothetical protein
MKKRARKEAFQSKSTVIGRKTFEAIMAVEGLELSSDGRKRVSAAVSVEKKRAAVLRAYTASKKRK